MKFVRWKERQNLIEHKCCCYDLSKIELSHGKKTCAWIYSLLQYWYGAESTLKSLLEVLVPFPETKQRTYQPKNHQSEDQTLSYDTRSPQSRCIDS